MKKIERKGNFVYTYEFYEVRTVRKAVENQIAFLRSAGLPYRLEKTSSVSRFIFPDGRKIEYVPAWNMGGNGMKFIRDVKKHFAGLEKPERISSERPFYEYFRPISIYTEIENTCEIDINKAYWESAYQLGYLSRELYETALSASVPKKARLIGLGVLGKKTETEIWDGVGEGEKKEEYADTRIFWDNIVWKTGEVMREAVATYKPHVFGMWFDAIFCACQIAPAMRSFFHRRGFSVKVIPLQSYVVQPRDGVLPGAKIKRIFRNGEVKEMDVSYIPENVEKISMEQFLLLLG